MDDNQVQAIKRHFDIVAEGLKHEISIVAEGYEVIRCEAGEFRSEVKEEFKEVNPRFLMQNWIRESGILNRKCLIQNPDWIAWSKNSERHNIYAS